MALTTTQINQAYLAILGRGAVGTESNVGANASVSSVAASLITAAAKDNSEMFTTLADRVLAEGNGLDNDTFVESLYTTFLNRGSDEEGKAYWLSALNSGMTRKDLVASVIDAIVSQKAANSQDYQNYLAQVSTQADAFVESLYQNLLGREADAEGKAYWISLIADGASYADIAANAAAAALAQGKDTIDGATVANRLEVADYATTNLTSFSKLTTAADIEAIKENLKQTIANITSNAESVADYKTDIDTAANTYKAPGSVPFTKKEGEELGIDANTGKYNTSKATDFKGTINISNAANSTIHTSDKVTANPEFADGSILTVNVTGANKDNNTLNLSNLPAQGNINGVNNLVINANTAAVSGDISTDFTKTVTINAGYTSKDVKNASDITVAGTLDTYTAGSQADKLTVIAGGKIANIKMGAGNDTIVLQNNASVTNIDAGAGTQDTLQLTSAASASASYTSIKSITGVEIIDLLNASDATSGAKIAAVAIDGENITLKNTAGSGSGTLSIDMTDVDSLDISKFKNDATKAVAGVTITGATSGDTITLSNNTTIKETVDLTSITSGAATVTNAHKAEDTIKFTNAQVNSTGFTDQDITSASIGTATKVSVSTSGAITFKASNNDPVTNLTVAQVQDAIVAVETASSSRIAKDDVVFYKDAQNIVYLINVGVTSDKNDDIIVNLGAMDVAKISANTNVISFA